MAVILRDVSPKTVRRPFLWDSDDNRAVCRPFRVMLECQKLRPFARVPTDRNNDFQTFGRNRVQFGSQVLQTRRPDDHHQNKAGRMIINY
jgi:hypothetical protein